MFYNFFQRDHPILPRSNKISHRQQKTVATEEKPRYSRIEPFIASCKSGRPVYTGLPLILLFAPRQLAPQKQQRHAGADHHRQADEIYANQHRQCDTSQSRAAQLHQ